MRFLGIGQTNDLAAMYRGLSRRGHEVRVHVENADYRGIFAGMLDFTEDWQAELDWVRQAGKDGVILFESASHGPLQDSLRREGFQVIGGSALGDRLEGDREFGQAAFRSIGLQTAAQYRFVHHADASAFVLKHPGRYVLKFNDANAERTRNYIGQMDSGQDMLACLALLGAGQDADAAVDFVLMQHVRGVEVGVGAYFNGHEFLSPACIDFEHKRFFPGDLGELTGEMGTIVSYRSSQALFAKVLAPLEVLLRDGGYCGYINVNLIVNEDGVWPLEFTSRFGYPGYAICEALHAESWEAVFMAMLQRQRRQIATLPGFAAGVVLSVPPFPYTYGYETLSKGMPICLADGSSACDQPFVHLAEVALRGSQLVTSGARGYVGVATGLGATPARANRAALHRAQAVVVPNLRYRTDIGDAVQRTHWQRLRRLGWVSDSLQA